MKVEWLGRVAYDRAAALQEQIRHQVLDGGEERLLLLEHDPVVTLGRGAEATDILDAVSLEKLGVTISQSSRGGQVTYHGPGQLVAYAIVRIKSIVAHVEALCEAASSVAKSFGVEARYRRDCPGVWVGDKKLASVGVHVHKHVTMHGLALNVSTALEPFQLIRACGMQSRPTSIALESGKSPTPSDVASQYASAFLSLR